LFNASTYHTATRDVNQIGAGGRGAGRALRRLDGAAGRAEIRYELRACGGRGCSGHDERLCCGRLGRRLLGLLDWVAARVLQTLQLTLGSGVGALQTMLAPPEFVDQGDLALRGEFLLEEVRRLRSGIPIARSSIRSTKC